jgi:hypothetical protein
MKLWRKFSASRSNSVGLVFFERHGRRTAIVWRGEGEDELDVI